MKRNEKRYLKSPTERGTFFSLLFHFFICFNSSFLLDPGSSATSATLGIQVSSYFSFSFFVNSVLISFRLRSRLFSDLAFRFQGSKVCSFFFFSFVSFFFVRSNSSFLLDLGSFATSATLGISGKFLFFVLFFC